MPKGALLRTHLDLTVGARTLLDIALRHPAIHISAPECITTANKTFIQPNLRPITTNSNANITSLTDPAYHSDAWVPLATARQRFDIALGGPDGFDRWLISKMSINPSDAYITHNNNIRVRTAPWVTLAHHAYFDQIWDVFRSATTLTRVCPSLFVLARLGELTCN